MFSWINYLAVLAGIIFLPLAVSLFEAIDYNGKSCSSSCAMSEVVRLIRAEISDVKNLIVANQLSTVDATKRALVSALVRE